MKSCQNNQFSENEVGRVVEWMELSKEILADSRPLTDWERHQIEEFFWLQFKQEPSDA